jgi:hypothetical protein
VYSEGNVVASRLTVLGCLMTRAPAGQGAVRLEDVRVVAAPIAVGSRGGLICDPHTDDDEVIFTAYAYPNPAGSRELRYRINANWIISNAGSHVMGTVGSADNLTRKQAEDLILQMDAATTPGLKGSNGGSITSREGKSQSLTNMRRYFAELEDPPPHGGVFLDFDINRLLRLAMQPRVLLWRARPE